MQLPMLKFGLTYSHTRGQRQSVPHFILPQFQFLSLTNSSLEQVKKFQEHKTAYTDYSNAKKSIQSGKASHETCINYPSTIQAFAYICVHFKINLPSQSMVLVNVTSIGK